MVLVHHVFDIHKSTRKPTQYMAFIDSVDCTNIIEQELKSVLQFGTSLQTLFSYTLFDSESVASLDVQLLQT